MRVLIVEDEQRLASVMRRGLEDEGVAVDVCTRGEDALWMASATPFDAIMLDVMLPDMDGFATCRALREREVWTPIIMVTARGRVEDRVAGLDAGADDYLVKPFALAELLARVRALLRRSLGDPTSSEAVLSFDDITLSLDRLEATRGERVLELTRTELRLLELFLRNPGRVLSREQMLDRVWGVDAHTSSNGVEVYVGYLRRKLEEDDASRVIQTVRGLGYVLRA